MEIVTTMNTVIVVFLVASTIVSHLVNCPEIVVTQTTNRVKVVLFIMTLSMLPMRIWNGIRKNIEISLDLLRSQFQTDIKTKYKNTQKYT
jgi:hypothetical protein